MRRITVAVPEDVADRLAEMARREFREPKEQAAWLILDGLRRAGVEAEAPERRPKIEART